MPVSCARVSRRACLSRSVPGANPTLILYNEDKDEVRCDVCAFLLLSGGARCWRA
jgi:hypothetical protein